MANPITPTVRDIIFLSKATPGDDEFALWLAPKLEAEGYKVFADILTLEPGDRWRREITGTLQDHAVKMLLCCRDSTLAKEGVQEEIGIALDLCKSLGDKKFLIPLRLEPYKKLFGIGELQYIDFVRGWGEGYGKLLDTLKRQKVPCNKAHATINPNWEVYRRRGAVPIKEEPERLTSNWLRVAEAPDVIRYFEPTGMVDRAALQCACDAFQHPTQLHLSGFLSFADLAEINSAFGSVGSFVVKYEIPLTDFVVSGFGPLGLARQVASNMIHSMFRQAWITYCRQRGLLEYRYSNAVGFHVSKDQAKIGDRIPWGKQGERRWSMLRNIAKGHVWQFGVTAIPAFWPYFHFKLKSRVLFAADNNTQEGLAIDDARKQHRLRRTVCKGWRNKQWYGRMLAFLEMLSGESAFIRLPLSANSFVVLDASPLLFTSPVSTPLPDTMADDQEEEDTSTLGRPEPEEVE
jgi:hypothetical protein